MTTIEQTVVRARVATAVKDEAAGILRGKGLTVSDLMRETLLRVIDTGDVPFPVRNPVGSVVDKSRTLAQVNFDAGMKLLPELHQARWAEHYGELMRDRTKARAAGDTAKVEELRQAILDHHKSRYDTTETRQLIEAQYRRESAEEVQAVRVAPEGRSRDENAAHNIRLDGPDTTRAHSTKRKHGHAR